MTEKTTMYDKYLDPEVRAHFTERFQHNPREWVIIHLIYDGKPLEEAPFEIVDMDRQFYDNMKADFEAHRAVNPDFYYAYLPDVD